MGRGQSPPLRSFAFVAEQVDAGAGALSPVPCLQGWGGVGHCGAHLWPWVRSECSCLLSWVEPAYTIHASFLGSQWRSEEGFLYIASFSKNPLALHKSNFKTSPHSTPCNPASCILKQRQSYGQQDWLLMRCFCALWLCRTLSLDLRLSLPRFCHPDLLGSAPHPSFRY